MGRNSNSHVFHFSNTLVNNKLLRYVNIAQISREASGDDHEIPGNSLFYLTQWHIHCILLPTPQHPDKGLIHNHFFKITKTFLT